MKDSYAAMVEAVQAFHDKHDFKNTGGEELLFRVALMAEELGEVSECVTKGKGSEALAEECADLLILLLGTQIAFLEPAGPAGSAGVWFSAVAGPIPE